MLRLVRRIATTCLTTSSVLIGKSAGYRDIDGGAAAGALPHFLFGEGPISKTNLPPPAMSAWLNQGWFSGLPFNVADWM
jgi:hypothetical protein